ncbi:TetR/AcrR family transcriptional regulator [Schauerella aestuarii]|uniref:TetR/AcrR family transcriptional regulator n=1 Tax=Schauerella aestuarii TaxID=2511204 RepID=UPI00136B9848|nr:TetR/AcrR family transcriptional regulator [Achromobacter aestuarii]
MTPETGISMAIEREETRLAVSRNAARLFLERGVAGTSGDDIAAASGLSKRTVWRYFRTKESCVEPLFSTSALGFVTLLKQWPHDATIETYLHAAIQPTAQTPEKIADEVLAVRLIALMPDEPALRTAWLMACQLAEEEVVAVIADRVRDPVTPFDLRLCAAAITAAIRVIDEDISIAAVKHGQPFTLAEVVDRLAAAIRTASTLPICDPMI